MSYQQVLQKHIMDFILLTGFGKGPGNFGLEESSLGVDRNDSMIIGISLAFSKGFDLQTLG